jgi:transcriptional regulator with XRE-family HTH domain
MPPIRDLSDLARELRLRRRDLELTQDQLAAVSGLNRRVIGELERGRISARFETVLSIANALGLDVELQPRGR